MLFCRMTIAHPVDGHKVQDDAIQALALLGFSVLHACWHSLWFLDRTRIIRVERLSSLKWSKTKLSLWLTVLLLTSQRSGLRRRTFFLGTVRTAQRTSMRVAAFSLDKVMLMEMSFQLKPFWLNKSCRTWSWALAGSLHARANLPAYASACLKQRPVTSPGAASYMPPELARTICRQHWRWPRAFGFSLSWPQCLGTCAHRTCALEVAREDEIFIPFGDLVAHKDMAGQGQGGTASCALGALCRCLAHKWPLQFSSPAACPWGFWRGTVCKRAPVAHMLATIEARYLPATVKPVTCC